MKSIVILISGNGSNMIAIIEACKKESWNATIQAVICNNSQAYGLKKAKEYGIKTFILDHRKFSNRIDFDLALMKKIDQFSPDLVVLAGFMRILTKEFVLHYQYRLLNIHPSLIPQFPGLNTHSRAVYEKAKQHGATVHFVTEKLDQGPIIIQSVIPLKDKDTETIIKKKVLQQEHHIYPLAIRWFIEERLHIKDNKVLIHPPETQIIYNN